MKIPMNVNYSFDEEFVSIFGETYELKRSDTKDFGVLNYQYYMNGCFLREKTQNIKLLDLPECSIISFENKSDNQYNNLAYIDVLRENNNISIHLEICWELDKWDSSIDISRFIEILSECMQAHHTKDNRIFEWLPEEKINVTAKLSKTNYLETINNNLSINDLFDKIEQELLACEQNIKKLYKNIDTYIKEINIPIEYQQPASSLLSYFLVIFKQKHPNIKLSLSVKHVDNRLFISLDYPIENEIEVQQVLYQYGQVINGEISARDFLNGNKLAIMELEHKLDMTRLDLQHTRDRLEYERSENNRNRLTLEQELITLKKLLGDSLQWNLRIQSDLSQLISKTITGNSAHSKSLLHLLKKAIEEKDEKSCREALINIQKDEPSIFSTLNDLIIKGAISGASGNFFYQWLQPIINSIPLR